MLPDVVAGTRKTNRRLSDVAILVSPMIATGRTKAEVERKKIFVKQRLGFYASTRSYHPPLKLHGYLDVGQRLFQLSMEGKWRDMIDLVSDQMLDDFATVATCDELGAKLKERWGDVASVLHLDLPPEVREDRASVRTILDALR